MTDRQTKLTTQNEVVSKKSLQGPGKLQFIAAELFECAYGLNGRTRFGHSFMISKIVTALGCSEKAVWALFYGSSYEDEVGHLRRKVPGYKSCRVLNGNFSMLPFYNYDGNATNLH